MAIRWKLLILLLLTALVPLAVLSLLQRRTTARLGDELAARIRNTLADDAELQLRHLIDDYRTILRHDQEIIELALQAQAREVEKRLAAEPPQEYPRVYFSRDFDVGGSAPPNLVLSPKHFMAPGGAEATPMPVTYSDQVFKLAPGVALKDVAQDVARLTKVLPIYQFLTKEHPELFYWNYTSLESGVHTSFPGHGGYPPEYDPRKRTWYRKAVEQGTLTWDGPVVDASSLRLLMTAAVPVRYPDGSLAGVTAIDVPLRDMLGGVGLPAEWAAEAAVLLVTFIPDAATGEIAPVIVAQEDYHRRERRWDMPITAEPLDSDDKDTLGKMVARMQQLEAGVQRMPYKGRESLWVYGRLSRSDVYLVVIAPYDHIVAEAVNAETYVLDRTLEQLQLAGTVLVGVIVIVGIIAFFVSRTITRPIRRLAHAARHLAAGDFQARADVTGRDELAQMGRTFNEMVPQLQDNLRMRQSLTLAMEVQQNLLPAGPPQVSGLDVAGSSDFCDETGGDYYDFLDLSKLTPHRLGVAVGDVTGHGIAAALLMATARALLRSHAAHPHTLAKMIADINNHLTADTPVGQFMTLFYMVIDRQQKNLSWVSAGHDPAMIYTPATDSFSELGGADIPLGIEAEYAYSAFDRDGLEPGQVIVIGTDGIWDTRNANGARFGKDALREVVRRHADRSADDISRAITDALADFRQAQPQEDDVTLVVIKIA